MAASTFAAGTPLTPKSKVVRLELDNFKSYHGKVTVGPFLDFTCIVGPNGAGKSNLMDALSFVLGTTAATLRASKNEDFINRKAKKTESASVALVLATPSSVETVLTRTISPSGQLATFVNGTKVSESEFRAVLAKHGIAGRISNFLVFQHEVEAVAQKKARELTDLLEAVSGSGELKAEYVELKKQMDAANEQLAAASVDKRGAMAEVAQLKLQKREAEKYEDILSKLTDERRNLALMELFHIEAQLTKCKGQLDTATAAASRLEGELGTDDESKRLKKTLADNHKEYLELLRENREAASELRDKRATLERIRISVQHFQTRLEKEQRDLQDSRKTGSERDTQLRQLQEQVRVHEQLLQQKEREWAQEDAELAKQSKLDASQMAEYKRLRKEADCATISLRQESDTKRRFRDGLSEGLKQSQKAMDAQRAIQADAVSAKQRMLQRISEAEDRNADLRKDHDDSERRLAQVRTTLSQLQTQLKGRKDELESVEAQLHELRFVKEDVKQNSRATEALVTIKSMFPGVRGKLIELCVPKDNYKVAVTAAMGKNLDGVVVDTMETAIACVRYLKSQRLAPMTFIPLQTIQGAAVDDRLRTLGGDCRPVIDVVKFDAAIEPAVRFALGQTLVCGTLTDARRFAYGDASGERHKVVTIQGDVLLKNGSVQGGLASLQSRARRWDEKEYDRLKARRAELARELGQGSETEEQRALCEAKELQSKITFTSAKIANGEKDIAGFKLRLKSLDADIKKVTDSLEDLQNKKVTLEGRIAEVEGELAKLQRESSKIEKDVFAEFTRRTGIANIADIERKADGLSKVRAEEKQKLTLVIHKLKTAIEAESTRLGVRSSQDIAAAVTATQREITTASNDLKSYTAIVDKVAKKHEGLQERIVASKKALEELENRIRAHGKASETEARQLAAHRKTVTTLQAACAALRRQRESLYLQCRMDEVDIPTTNEPSSSGAAAAASGAEEATAGRKRARGADSRADAPGASSHQPRNIQTSESFKPYSESGGDSSGSGSLRRTRSAVDPNIPVCIDFSKLSAELREGAINDATFAGFKQRTEALIDQYGRELEALAPNLKAKSRVDTSERKLDTTSSTLEAARERARTTTQNFERVKQSRTTKFMAMYDKITEHVDRVYRELTMGTRASNVHGTAYLSLEDPEEPYNGGTKYHATPPMKRFMTMDVLSGGERTMAALALLFAIHSVSPAPFFVLDEVDAALDVGNVTKLAEYVRNHSSHCQFIVVSLKEQLYHVGDSLIGVFKDHARESSGTSTLDLRKLTN